MKRRAFIIMLGGAVAWPLAAQSQGVAKLPLIGFIGPANLGERVKDGLRELGFVEGENVAIEILLGGGQFERAPELVADLIHRGVAVICTASNVAALAAKRATSDIPIVFIAGLDPVRMGLVSAINRPGGNATGVSFLTSSLEPKRFGLIRELLPPVALFAALVNPDNPNAESHTKDLQAAAHTLGLQALILKARSAAEIETAFQALVQQHAGALLVTSDPIFDGNRQRLVDLAARHAIPTIYPWRDFVDAGGLLSYGNSLNDAARQVGVYAGRILKGAKPAELPVWVPTRFEFVLNLKTAKTLGLTIPPSILASVDEVIE